MCVSGRCRVTESVLRVGLDLDGSLESLGDSMNDLADALAATGDCDLVRYRSAGPIGPGERGLPGRRLWGPAWRRGRGRVLDRALDGLDLLHVAGLATPPTRRIPLVVSVDDLRPLRGEQHTHQRVAQLRRALDAGATLVASSRVASHEVLDVLGAARAQVAVVPPAVPVVAETTDGTDLVLNVTGAIERLLGVLDELVDVGQRLASPLVVLASEDAAHRVRATNAPVLVRERREARTALGRARCVLHLSDGARLPSFAIAALAAGVPTVARSTSINRELLGGAAILVDDNARLAEALLDSALNEPRRAILRAAGRDRARDFAPQTAAGAYLDLYRRVVQGWAT